MARVLIAIWPFVGHINPFVPVAAALRARGHEVAFYTGSSARPVLEAEGFRVFAFQRVDEDLAWGAVKRAERSPLTAGRSLGVLRSFRDWLAGTVPDQVADLEDVLREWQPAVIVTETAMWGPSLVLWEATGVPVAVASTLLGCLIPGPDAPVSAGGLPLRGPFAPLLVRVAHALTDALAAGMRADLNRVRARYGLAPMGGSVNAFTARLPLYLVPSVTELDYDRGDLPPSVHYVGPCVWSKPARADPPDWLADLRTDQPWVHVTEGTVHFQDPFLLRAAVRGLADGPWQAILTTGPQRELSALDLGGPPAANVRVERWVPHADLLPRCSVLVTTGGAGTVMAALQAAVPMVIVPTLWDKADNAARVVQAGVGIRLNAKQCTPKALRAAVERVLSQPTYRANARRLAARLAESPGPARAAELVERLADSNGAARANMEAIAAI